MFFESKLALLSKYVNQGLSVLAKLTSFAV